MHKLSLNMIKLFFDWQAERRSQPTLQQATLMQYFRLLKMLYTKATGNELDGSVVKDINDVCSPAFTTRLLGLSANIQRSISKTTFAARSLHPPAPNRYQLVLTLYEWSTSFMPRTLQGILASVNDSNRPFLSLCMPCLDFGQVQQLGLARRRRASPLQRVAQRRMTSPGCVTKTWFSL